MANSTTGQVWVFDTASTTAVVYRGAVRIKSVYWYGPTTIGHTFILRDAAGRLIQEGTCEVAAQSQFFLKEEWFQGLIMHTLDSGKLELQVC